jgi:hypothetical protein
MAPFSAFRVLDPDKAIPTCSLTSWSGMASGIENEIDPTFSAPHERKGTKLSIYRDYSSTNK